MKKEKCNKHQKRLEVLASVGICIACAKRPAREGQFLCETCAARNAKNQAAKRLKERERLKAIKPRVKEEMKKCCERCSFPAVGEIDGERLCAYHIKIRRRRKKKEPLIRRLKQRTVKKGHVHSSKRKGILQMKILSLTLENFRNIKNLTVNFDGRDTDIYAANGAGKTTIANAICWLLIDRPATEEKDFEPKTIGVHGCKHKATMTVLTDKGAEIILGKTFYEKWTRKKGAASKEYTGNTTDCFVNGVKTKAKDYADTVERICGVGADKIKLLMILGCFADTMKTDEKRKILFEMCGEFSDADVIAANKYLADLPKFLPIPGTSGENYSIEEYAAIAKEQRRGFNKELETIPIRIDELKKSLPEAIADTDKLTAELAALEKEKADIEEEMRQAAKPDGQKEAVKSALAELKTELETKRAECIRQGAEVNQAVNVAIDELTTTQRQLNDKIYSADKGRKQREEQRTELMKKRQGLVNEYAAVKQETWDAGAEICPTCGQKLPTEKIEAHRREFTRKKSEKLAAINKRGQSCSQAVIQQLEAEIAELFEKAERLQTEYAENEKRLNSLRATLTEQAPFEDTEEYACLAGRIEELEAKRDEQTDASSETMKIYAEKIAAVNMQIAVTKSAKTTQKRIVELETDLRIVAAKLESVEYSINLCEEFARTKARLITDSINGHFSLVNFKLFRDQINGGLKEVCEPMVKNDQGEWVEYKSVNFAGQVNAKLDIANTLNKHYCTNLPLILDQAESVTEPLAVDEQLIRLIVSADDKGLRVVQREAEKSIINQTQATAKAA